MGDAANVPSARRPHPLEAYGARSLRAIVGMRALPAAGLALTESTVTTTPSSCGRGARTTRHGSIGLGPYRFAITEQANLVGSIGLRLGKPETGHIGYWCCAKPAAAAPQRARSGGPVATHSTSSSSSEKVGEEQEREQDRGEAPSQAKAAFSRADIDRLSLAWKASAAQP